MDMYELVDSFGKQLHTAVEIAKGTDLKIKKPISNILISGLGGSGIGGDIAAQLATMESTVPIQVSKTYFIPAYVGPETLVIISSYSGNTEETFQALETSYERKAQIVCITSGGKIEKFAREKNLGLVIIPSGMPPRACLGYSLVQQLNVLFKAGALKASLLDQINDSANQIIANKSSIQQEARHIAAFLYGKIPVLYTTTYHEGLAIRWRQQLNENSKVLCWHHIVPEMNHNELVGWRQTNDKLAVLFLRHEDDYYRNNSRIAINQEVIAKYTPHLMDVHAKGTTSIQRLIYMIHLGDWISIYLAQLNEMDPIEINVINHLKGELDKLK